MTAEAFPLIKESAKCFYRQFIQRKLPQSGKDVVFEEIPMRRIGAWPAFVFVEGFLPVSNVFPHGHIPTSMHWLCKSRKATQGSRAFFRIFLCR